MCVVSVHHRQASRSCWPLLPSSPYATLTVPGAPCTPPSLALEHAVAMPAHAPGSGAAVPGYCVTAGDQDDEGQGAEASALSLLSRRREKIPCGTGILREMG